MHGKPAPPPPIRAAAPTPPPGQTRQGASSPNAECHGPRVGPRPHPPARLHPDAGHAASGQFSRGPACETPVANGAARSVGCGLPRSGAYAASRRHRGSAGTRRPGNSAEPRQGAAGPSRAGGDTLSRRGQDAPGRPPVWRARLPTAGYIIGKTKASAMYGGVARREQIRSAGAGTRGNATASAILEARGAW